jgi:DNA helicase MCM9
MALKGVDGATEINLAIFANNLCVANNQIISQVVTDEQKEQFRSFWEHHEQDELEGRNQLMASFCPQVYGLFLVKLAVRYEYCTSLNNVR